MTLTRFIGDIHGDVQEMRSFALHGWEGPSVQVGDYGVGFGQSEYWHDTIDSYCTTHPHRFIRGNHDNPDLIKTMKGWIPDGKVENDVMYIGGAWSIDHAWRTPGRNWWDTEQCSDVELDIMEAMYEIIRPRVMVTHDCPIEVSDEMFIKTGLAMGGREAKQIPNRTNMALQRMFEIHSPDLWIFGHWHVSTTKVIRGTKFRCLGILEYEDFDI